LKRVAAIIDKISSSFRWLAIAIMVFMVVIIVIEVTSRYAFRSPVNWEIEMLETAQALIAALAAAWVLLEERHILVSMVPSHLSPRKADLMYFVGSIIGAIWCAVMVWTGWIMIQRSINLHEATELLRIPFPPIRIVFVFGFLIFMLAFISRSYKYYHSAMSHSSNQQEELPGHD